MHTHITHAQHQLHTHTYTHTHVACIFLSHPFHSSVPTIILTECVLVYMEPEKSKEVIKWFGKRFDSAIFLNYEPVRNTS